MLGKIILLGYWYLVSNKSMIFHTHIPCIRMAILVSDLNKISLNLSLKEKKTWEKSMVNTSEI